MKKNIIAAFILAAATVSALAAFADDSEPILIAPAPIAAIEPLLDMPQITVDGETVELSNTGLSRCVFDAEENGNTMVPLRAVAEKMGYTVDWNGETQAVMVSNDTWEVVLQIGTDSYYGVTKIKDAVGMTALQSYGTAPTLVENTTFVPAKMFELMGYTDVETEQFVMFIKSDAAAVQLPNPFVSYEDIEAAEKALNFEPALPTYIPEGFIIDEISVPGNDFLQIVYKDKDDNRLSFRTAKRNEDISGDYNTYSINKEVVINDMKITLHGNEKIAGAVWNDGEYSFAVLSDKELEEDSMMKFIAEIK